MAKFPAITGKQLIRLLGCDGWEERATHTASPSASPVPMDALALLLFPTKRPLFRMTPFMTYWVEIRPT